MSLASQDYKMGFRTFLAQLVPILKSDLAFQKKLCYLFDWKPFKTDEKCFLFHLKSSFRSKMFKVLSRLFGEYILIALNLPNNKNILYKTLNYWSRDMLNFNFSEKRLRLVSLLHFAYDFSRKMFFILHCINWPNFIV